MKKQIEFDFLVKWEMAEAVNQWLHEMKAKGRDLDGWYGGYYINRTCDIKYALETGIEKAIEKISNFTEEQKSNILNLPEELK